MRVELHPVFNVHINLENLLNVDLSTRGYYQIRLTPRPSSSFTSADIQCIDSQRPGEAFILPPCIVNGVGVSRSVELTYIDEELPLGDSFLVSLRLDAHADLELTYTLVLDVELWSMDRHRPPNFTFFEIDCKRTLEIVFQPSQLVAASRQLFFDQCAFAALKLTVFASLVSVLPRRKRQPPDPLVDPKSKHIHLTTGNVLLNAISSIERFVIENMNKLMSSIQIDPCDVEREMRSLRCRFEATTNPWVELEHMAVSLSSRLSLLFGQVVRLCTGSAAMSSMLLQNYLKFREKMLAEVFFFVENSSNDLSRYTSTDKIFLLIAKSAYLERLPRFPLFCPEADSSYTNWCLVVEERYAIDSNSAHVANLSSNGRKLVTPTVGAMGDGFRLDSRFSWLRRKNTKGSITPRNVCTSQLHPQEHPVASLTEEHLDSVVDFVIERERLKAALAELGLCDAYLYSEQARSRLSADFKSPVVTTTHLVVFVHGLEGTCEDLSSYRNIFRVIAGDIHGFHYLLSASNHSKTWSDIDDMAGNLLSEVQCYVSKYSELPSRISFVAHSLGGVIVRAAVCRDEADWLRPRLHCLLTINSPHLGLAYVGKGVNLGIQFMQWWKQSRSVEQLSLKDEVAFCDSFLFRLSQKKTFGLFRKILLIGTPADLFVPCHSALVAPCKSAMKDLSAMGSAYREMMSNVHDDIVTSDRTTVAIRYSTWHSISSPKASRFTGRAAHIAAVEDDIFIEKLFAISALKHFIE
ncbi:unnamed protein product [Cylicocyclus nassatus]|uniref:DUF676 domain-containing protein n=1 Tax=Cylicocyclus nassatus TaxID=53992 RepID=A0AA36M3Y3_CYLNA|nr:unnamed protein product [Cylicocyclus nassatus]